MFYTPRYRSPHELLTAAGFNPAGRGVRGYERTSTQLLNAGYKFHHVKGIDRVHAVVAHGYINLHADVTKQTITGKKIHVSQSGYIVRLLMSEIQGGDIPNSKFEKMWKDAREWAENRRTKYRVFGFRGLVGQI